MATLQARLSLFRQVTTAARNFATARLAAVIRLPASPNWQARAEICESCHLRFIRCGESYCGKPYLEQIDRDPATEGCGCPCRDKAKSRKEHCPLTEKNEAATCESGNCNCKWCAVQ